MRVASTPIERLRLFAVSAALTFVFVAQDAGRMAADTKLDLVVDPGRFLSQALSLWDPLGEGGRVQNQAYGYLFPMGPFFALARLIDLPPWATQRFWESALVVAAFLGMYCVARSLGVTRFWPSVCAGLAFALTPRVLSQITSNSAELLPTMVLPWVLLPLVRGAERGSPRRAAALSAIAVLFAGGANAGATLAILPVPLVWLLTRARGPRRTGLLRWSTIAFPLATLWWLLPLLVFGRYSPPFVDWIEGAGNTTVSTSLLAALRGVPHWVPYLGPTYWPPGWLFVSRPAIVFATAVVAAAGLAGLSRRDAPHRLFLCTCLGLGLVAVTFGHAAAVGPVFDEEARAVLDGPLVAFRNVHKFQGLITLPLAVGLGLALDRSRVREPRALRSGARIRELAPRLLLVTAAVSVGAVAVGPALGNRLVAATRDEPVAEYWKGAARWLASNGGGTRALIVPGAPFPTYLWGETVDDAIQPIARSPWVVRSAVPLAQPGLIRLLDVVEWRLATGRPDASLADLLARSGIGFVVVRNDLDSVASAAVPHTFVRRTLQLSPGFERAAVIGPRVGEPTARSWVVDGGAGGARTAIEIYAVASVSSPVSLLNAEGTIRSNGSTDTLASLVDAGLPVTTPVVFGADGAGMELGTAVSVLTEGVRRQQDSFGGPFRRSGTLSASEPFRGERAVYDYLPDGVGELSTFRYVGIANVTASSSASDVLAVFNANPAFGAWSALDGSPHSAWRSAAWTGALGQWLEVQLTEPVDVGSIDVAFGQDFRPLPVSVEVTTDSASDIESVHPDASLQTIDVPEGATTRLRLTLREVDGGGPGTSFGIAHLGIPGIDPLRTLDVPSSGLSSVIRFAVASGYRSDCLDLQSGVTCDPAWARSGEEDTAIDRSFELTERRVYEASAFVRVVPGPELNRVLDAGASIHATATSVDSADPRHRPGAALDRDPATAWVADPDEELPTLSLHLGAARTVRALRLVTAPESPIARPTVVWIHAGDQDWIGRVPRDGLIRLPSPAHTGVVEITIVEAEDRYSTSTLDNSVRLLPAGISEVRLDPGPATEEELPTTIELGCDAGLSLFVDGSPIRFSLTITREEALAGSVVRADTCYGAAVPLNAGTHRITFAAEGWTAPESLTLAAADLSTVHGAPGEAQIERWDATSRRIRLDAETPAILLIHENFNDGWTARINGRRLEPIRVDGWQQGFMVPAGSSGVVELTYRPQRMFVAGLGIGAAGVPALITIAAIRPRRRLLQPVGERRVTVSIGIGLMLLMGLVLGGPPGIIAVAAVLLVVSLPGADWARQIPTATSPTALIVAGAIVATAPSDRLIGEASTPIVQTLSVVAVAIAFAAGFPRQGRSP